VPIRPVNRGQQRCDPMPTGAPAERIHAGQKLLAPASAVASQAESASSILVTRSTRNPRSPTWGLFVVWTLPAARTTLAPAGRKLWGPRLRGRIHVCHQDHFDRFGGRSTDLGPVCMVQRACPCGGTRPTVIVYKVLRRWVGMSNSGSEHRQIGEPWYTGEIRGRHRCGGPWSIPP
jgi:hypothetical protein